VTVSYDWRTLWISAVAFILAAATAGSAPAEAQRATISRGSVATFQPVDPAVDLPQSISENRVPRGYSVGNFGIAAAISENGLKIEKSLINPPVLRRWLEPLGRGELSLKVGGRSDFAVSTRYSVFPENLAQLLSPASGVEADVETFAPISAALEDQADFINFIPAIVIQVKLSNHSAHTRSVDLSYQWSPSQGDAVTESEKFPFNGMEIREVHQGAGPAQIWLMVVPDERSQIPSAAKVAVNQHAKRQLSLGTAVNLEPQQSRSVSVVLGVYDSRGYTAARLSSRRALQRYLLTQGVKDTSSDDPRRPRHPTLEEQHSDLIAALPRIGDPELDVYLRWYLSAAVLLTKGIASGDVLTMGYKELNQRDSFWTTGVHLIYWPDLELKMLHESMTYQRPNGQIPLTILPVINRDNNIDGNEYFILRIARYYRWYRDAALLKEAMPHVKSAIDYLVSLDREGIGMPMQQSFWADWKDVPGVEGRAYAPHFDLLWLAALKSAAFLASESSDSAYASELNARYRKAYERINRDVGQGGLWDQSRYVDLWKDDRKAAYELEDQALAAIFDVIPHDRLESIYATLNKQNESKFGVRETYPYIPSFAQPYGLGEYHNGGIWPYLNFADAWGRFKNGRAGDAERILREVGYNDLARFNDFSPGEFLNGETGENEGYAVQGWDADFFSAIYFGALGLERLNATDLAVHVNLSSNRDFRTTIRVPEGDLTLSRVNGHMNIEKKLTRPLEVKVMH
jgi:Glycosyl-hydrolase family 116, catalytic region